MSFVFTFGQEVKSDCRRYHLISFLPILIDSFDSMSHKNIYKFRVLSVSFLAVLLLEIIPVDLKLMFSLQK